MPYVKRNLQNGINFRFFLLLEVQFVPEKKRPNIFQRWLFLESDNNVRTAYNEESLNEIEDNWQPNQSNMEVEELESGCSIQTSMESSLSRSYQAENILNHSEIT